MESADEMYNASVENFPKCDIAILCAAVADYKPQQQAEEKIKREQIGDMTLSLVRNKDIAAALGGMKSSGQALVGFALETKDGVVNAKEKLQRKNLDMIVLNSLSDEGAGFQCDTNKVILIDKEGTETEVSLKLKSEVAEDIVNFLLKKLTMHN